MSALHVIVGVYLLQELKDEEFTYVVVNPAFGGSMRGLQILRQHTPHTTSSIQVLYSTVMLYYSYRSSVLVMWW